MVRSKWAHAQFILICILILLLMQYCKRVRAKEDFFIVISHGWTDYGTGTCHLTGGVLSGYGGKTGKPPNEFRAVSPLELEKARTKQNAQQGVGWRVIWRKRRGEKDEGRKREACGLGGTFGVDCGPIFNWQASARLDDHQAGLAEMTRGQSRHATTWHRLPPAPVVLALPESSHNPTGNSICFCCSSALIKAGWLGQRHHTTHPDRTGAKPCEYAIHGNASHWPSRVISNSKYASGYSGWYFQHQYWFRFWRTWYI